MGGLARALVSRAVQAAVVALLVGTLCFALVHALPGDMAMRIAAARYGADLMNSASADAVRAELGLDRPAWVQYGAWLARLVTLDLGRSVLSSEPVIDEIAVQLGHSVLLALTALVVSLLLGPPLGFLCGLRPGSRLDMAALGAALAVRALPGFVVALILILLFSIWLPLLPPAGFGGWREMVLPSLTLALGLAAMSSRVAREAMARVREAPYFAFARIKGLPERAVVLRHGLRNTAIPVVAYLGLQLVYLVEGVVVIEVVFAYPGIGHALVHAVVDRDVPMLQGTALVMGMMFVLLNTAVDLACRAIDPRPAH